MSPERSGSNLPILQEALRIKTELMPARERIQAEHTLIEDREMQGVRERLGYPEPEEVNMAGLVDIRVTKHPMITPRMVTAVLPLSARSVATTLEARRNLTDIHAHRDYRLAVGLGECSVRNAEATLENAENTRRWQEKYHGLVLLQRTFFEKPRTPKERGSKALWKGYMYDPLLDGSNDINLGVIASRMLLCRVTDMGVATLKEQLNALTPQFLNGLVTQDNIGARKVSDQTSMEYISGTSAIGAHKNTLEGNIEVAMQAAASAHGPHAFLGIDDYGNLCLVRTKGNETAHVVLRGGSNGSNYSPEHIAEAKVLAVKYGLKLSLDVDASHGNSKKKAKNQLLVIESLSQQIADGETAITGVQMETNLVEGAQPFELGQNLDDLVYGQSITDECLGIEDTEACLYILNEAVIKRKELLSAS